MSRNKKRNRFKLTNQARELLLAAIKDLPAIPLMVSVNGKEPVAIQITKTVRKLGSEILLENANAKEGKKPIDPTQYYKRKVYDVKAQDHKAAIFKAYQLFGEEAIPYYCKQVWDYYEDLKTTPEEPAPLLKIV